MFGLVRAERADDCLSDLRFDAWLAGELALSEGLSLSEHLVSCPRCRTRHAGIVSERDRFFASDLAEPAWLQGRASRPLKRARLLQNWPAVALAAAACLLLFMMVPEPKTERSKGSEQISFFVKRGDAVERGTPARPVWPGDQLRFVYTALGTRYLAILSLDGAGQASVYFPPGERAARIEAGVDVPLPSAVELDGTLGQERVWALFCDTPIEIRALRAELSRKPQQLSAPPGCTLRRLDLIKEARTQ